MPFATGAVLVPTLAPGKPAELVVTLDRPMTGKFEVSAMPNAALLDVGADVVVVSHTQTTVTLRVTVKDGLAGAGAVFIICMPHTGPPADVPATPTTAGGR